MRVFILFVIFLFPLYTCLGQLPDSRPTRDSLYFEAFGYTRGLPSNEVRRMHKDREGLLWLATQNGLIRYDGYVFKPFRCEAGSPQPLKSNFISTIADDDKYLYVGTNNGLSYLDKSTLTIHTPPQEIFRNVTINKIIPRRDTIWMATSHGLYSCDRDSWALTKHDIVKDGVFENIKDIIIDSNGDMWIGVISKGLFRYNFDSEEFVFYTKGNCSDFAHVLYEDADKSIWVGSWDGGLTRIQHPESPRTARYTTFRTKPNAPYSIASDIVYTIRQDAVSGDLWVGGRYGLSILKKPFEKGHFENYVFDGKVGNLTNNDISDIYQDENSVMWLATIGGGLCKVDLKKASTILYDPLSRIATGLNTRYVMAVHADGKGRLWLGLKSKGLVIYDPSTGEYTPSAAIRALKNIPSTAKIISICSFKSGEELLLAAEMGDLYHVVLQNGVPVSSRRIRAGANSFVGYNYVNTIFQDRQKRIWVAHGSEITLLDEDLNVLTDKILGRKGFQAFVRNLAQSQEGDIFAGSSTEGILRIRIDGNDMQIRTYDTQNGKLNNDIIQSLFVDRSNNIWVGTQGGGLSRYDSASDTFIPVNDRYNIPYNDIFNIFQDRFGNIWMCSNNDIICLGEADGAPTMLYKSSGSILGNSFVTNCLTTISDSIHVVGGMNGLNYIEPLKDPDISHTPPLVISDIRIGYNSIYEHTEQQDRFRYADNRLTLNHKHKDFSIEFASLSYETYHNDQYAYRLLGYESDWNYIGTQQRMASYTNLKKGDYTFQVKSAGANGIWMQTPVELEVRILPSPFETWYAKVIYTLLVLAGLYVVYRITSNKMHMRRKLLIAELEKQKNEELTRSKLHFFTNISHEFLTPLTIIGCSAESIATTDEQLRNTVSTIKSNTTRLQNLIHQVLDFNKVESGKLELHVSEGNLSEMIRSICENDFSVLARQRNILLSCDIQGTVKGWYDADKIDKIMTNLLSNAFKYNFDNSYVTVSLQEDYDENHRYAVLAVKDGGMGIEPDKLDKIFEKYYSMDYRKDAKSKGTGIGMALVKALVELHKGSIRVESTLGTGTTFVVTIPINEKSYTETERVSKAYTLHEMPVYSGSEEQKKILFVEDNAELRHIVAAQLARLYTVDTATDGVDARQKLAENAYDLIVTDWMMPEMDGTELCRYVKTNIEYSHIPVIMLTAKSSDKDKITSYDLGADAFISKPFEVSLLVSRIENLMKGKERLIRNYAQSEDSVQLKSITYTTLDEKFIENAVKIVEENMSNEAFSLDDFVDVMNVSKSTLYRKIKSLTGMSTNEFIKDIRLKHACRIMKGKRMSISEIAYIVGFGQPKYFTYCFKKKYGMLPSEYMDQHEGGGNSRHAGVGIANSSGWYPELFRIGRFHGWGRLVAGLLPSESDLRNRRFGVQTDFGVRLHDLFSHLQSGQAERAIP